jgi:DNA-binding SARP family transcriptional activator
MGALEIKLFGPVQISHDNWKTKVSTTRVIQGLLAYLLLQRHRTHSREGLASLFWGEQNEERARGCLNTSLWRLRTILEPTGIAQGTYLMRDDSGNIGFNRESRHWLDIADFEGEINRILRIPYESIEEEQVKKLENVMLLYDGDLLEGFYDDWILREREKFRALYLNSLAYLMKYDRFHGGYEKALGYGQQILEIDPLREEIHREIIRLHVENRQRSEAVRQYKVCCEVLQTELDIQPMEETQALYQQFVLADKTSPLPHPKSDQNDIFEILKDLQLIAQSMEQMQAKLAREIEFLENYFKEKPRMPRVK